MPPHPYPLPSFPRKRESRPALPYDAASPASNCQIPAYAGMTVSIAGRPGLPFNRPSRAGGNPGFRLPSFPRKRESRPALPYTAASPASNCQIPAYAGMTVSIAGRPGLPFNRPSRAGRNPGFRSPSFPRKRESRTVLTYDAASPASNCRIPAYAGMTVSIAGRPAHPYPLPSFPRKRESRPPLPSGRP